jgi:hypothetical protein
VENDKEEEFPLASQIKTSQFTKTQFFLSQLCRKLPPDILKDLYESSQQSGRKHKCTPLKGSTPKRKRLLSPGTPSSISGSYDTVEAKF